MDWYGDAPDANATLNLFWTARVVSGDPVRPTMSPSFAGSRPDELPPTDELAFTLLPLGLRGLEVRMNVVFLFDVDNTLLDNDRVAADLRRHLDTDVDEECGRRYWELFEELRAELGYADYLGALQRYRDAHPRDLRILAVSHFLISYPFANRLFPASLDAVDHAASLGTAAILSDGDVVFQPRKISRAGLYDAVVGQRARLHPQGARARRRGARACPADHYVLVDDKVRILAAVKEAWGQPGDDGAGRGRATTRSTSPTWRATRSPDVTLERIGDLVDHAPRRAGRRRGTLTGPGHATGRPDAGPSGGGRGRSLLRRCRAGARSRPSAVRR